MSILFNTLRQVKDFLFTLLKPKPIMKKQHKHSLQVRYRLEQMNQRRYEEWVQQRLQDYAHETGKTKHQVINRLLCLNEPEREAMLKDILE